MMLGVSSAVLLVAGNARVSLDRSDNAKARIWVREGLIAARGILEENWGGVSPGAYGLVQQPTGTWSFAGSQNTNGKFTRQIVISEVDGNQRDIAAVVRWTGSGGREREARSVSRAVNWEGAVSSGGDTGGGGTAGDWRNPQTLCSIDLGAGNEATNLDVINKIIYISAEASSKNKPDLFIVDARGVRPDRECQSNDIFIASQLHTGAGLYDVDTAGGYAYAANADPLAELQVIDVSNITAPILIASFNLPGRADPDAFPRSVFYQSSKVYIGTDKQDNGGDEFHIVDVSNPQNPSSVGSYKVGDSISDIYVSGDRAYLATKLGGAGLMILDVSNPANITLLGQSYSVDTGSVFSPSAARTLLGPAQELYIVDTSNPASPITLGSGNPGNSVNDITARDNLVFLATSESNREFQTWDISNPASPTLWSALNFPQIGTGIDYEDNIIYMSVRSNDALRVITSQ